MPFLGCIIKFKLTSILAPNVYDCSRRGGGLLLSNVVDTKGEGVQGEDFLEIWVLNSGFCAL